MGFIAKSLELVAISFSSFTHYSVYVSAILSIHPTLSFYHYVHKPVLCVGVSILVLQIGSSVPFFNILYICINILIKGTPQ